MFVICPIAINVLNAVARLRLSTDSVMRALLAGFPIMKRAEKPMRKAKAMRKAKLPERISAVMERSLHAWEAMMTGFRPNLSERKPQAMRPAAVLRLSTLWMTPRPTTLAPVESM